MFGINNIEGMQGVSFGTLQQLTMLVVFLVFYFRSKDHRIPILALITISLFWSISSVTINPAISDYNGTMYFTYKALVDASCALILLKYHFKYEDDKDDIFYLAKFLAYIFWCNFVLNICSAIEYPTTYAIVYNMYDYLSPILNLLQMVILSSGIQNYVTRKIERSDFLHVSDRSNNSWPNVVFQRNNKTRKKRNEKSC